MLSIEASDDVASDESIADLYESSKEQQMMKGLHNGATMDAQDQNPLQRRGIVGTQHCEVVAKTAGNTIQ